MTERIVLNNSPVPFVILGPMGRKNVFILRSSDVTLDLLGCAIINGKRPSGLYSFSESFFQINKSHNIIRTKPVDIVKVSESDSDERLSEYIFCWSGNCNFQDGKQIAEMFELHISSILHAIENNDIEQAEFQISSIIYLCNLANETFFVKRKRSFNMKITYTLSFAVFVLLVSRYFSSLKIGQMSYALVFLFFSFAMVIIQIIIQIIIRRFAENRFRRYRRYNGGKHL